MCKSSNTLRVYMRRWWQQAEDPFQLLSAIMDIRGALLSGDPASYVSHCPIMMDGSCNGLQHYAALGRDRGGGAAVNLLDSDKPQASPYLYSAPAIILWRIESLI